MNLEQFLGKNITELFLQERDSFDSISLHKFCHIYFLELKENGLFFQSYLDEAINSLTIYIKEYDDFLPSNLKNTYTYPKNKQDLISQYGIPNREIPSIQINNSRPPTLLGWEYNKNNYKVIYHFNNNDEIIYINYST